MTPSATYKQAGVDIQRAGRFIEDLRPLAERTRRPGWMQAIGGFGGLFQIGPALFPKDPILVASADGVGAKLKLAQRANRYLPLGIDLVAMNVNDILCAGAEPLFFLDYMAVEKLDSRVLLEVVRGMVRACIDSRCLLLGGETAQMPLLYSRGDFDLAGFAVGVVGRRSLMTGEKIRPGDALLGLASSGLHSNGFTLVQKALSLSRQKRLAKQLLEPTRIYVRPVLDLLRKGVPVHGIAHITGGSFYEKLKRILPAGSQGRLRRWSWPVPSIFRKIQAEGVSGEEMVRTFNMGIGMVLALPPAAVSSAQRWLGGHRLRSWVIGEVARGRRGVEIR